MSSDATPTPAPTTEPVATPQAAPQATEASAQSTAGEIPPKPEAKPDAAVEAAAKAERESRRLALQAERERRLREQIDQVTAERAALKADREAAEAYKAALESLRKDPAKFLEFAQTHLGMGYEDWTRAYMLGEKLPAKETPKVDPVVEQLRQEIAELKAERGTEKEQKQKQLELAAEQQRQMAVDEHLQARFAYCKEHPDDFELTLASPQAAGEVYLDLYQQAWRVKNSLGANPTHEQIQRSKDLDDDEMLLVMKRVEGVLTERQDRILQSLRGTKRFRDRFAATPEPKQAAIEQPKANVTQPTVTTLTNETPRGTPVPSVQRVKKADKNESFDEMIARVRAKYPPKQAK